MFRKIDIPRKRFNGQIIFVAVGATKMDDVEYELPSGVALPFAVLPRTGEKVTIYDDGPEALVCGIVKSVEWSICSQEPGCSVFVYIEPLPTEPAENLPAKIYLDAERKQWYEDFRQAVHTALKGLISDRAINVVCSGARKVVMDVPDVAKAFTVKGRLVSFSEWANALLDGELTRLQLYAMGRMGLRTTDELMRGLREWKKSR